MNNNTEKIEELLLKAQDESGKILHENIITDPKFQYIKGNLDNFLQYLSVVSLELSNQAHINSIIQHLNSLISNLTALIGNNNVTYLDKAIQAMQQVNASRNQLIFNGPSNERIMEYENSIAITKRNLDELNAQISKQVIENSVKIDEFYKTRNDEFDNIKATLLEKNKEFDTKKETKIRSLMKEAEDNTIHIKKLSEILAGNAITDGFKKSANIEMLNKWFWQITFLISLSIIVIMTNTLLKSLTVTETEIDLSNTSIILRLFISVPLGFIATFSAKNAKNHDIYEKKYRQKELDLAAIKPFISNLHEEKRNQIIEELSKEIFNKDDSQLEMSKFKESFSVFEELTKLLQSLPYDFSKKS